jgi:hypothetical protein
VIFVSRPLTVLLLAFALAAIVVPHLPRVVRRIPLGGGED